MTLEANKAGAMAFYDLMFNHCRPAEAVDQFVGETYTQHNPAVGAVSRPSSSSSAHDDPPMTERAYLPARR